MDRSPLVSRQVSRRYLISATAFGFAAVLGLLQGCSPSAPSATVVPTAAPTQPIAPTAAKPSSAATAKPATAPPPTQAPPPPTAVPAVRTVQKLKYMGPQRQFATVIQELALRKGFYKDNGADVELQHFSQDTIAVKGLVAGELDAIDLNPANILIAIQQGAGLKLVGAPRPGLHLYLATKKDIKDLPDLAGRTMIVGTAGSLSWVLLHAVFRDANLPVEKVTMLASESGPGDQLKALIAGTVDATTIFPQDVKTVQNDPNLRVMFAWADRVPKYLAGAIVTSDKVLATKPDAIAGLIAGELKAVRFALDQKAETLASAKEIIPASDPEVLEFLYDLYSKKVWNPDGAVPADKLSYMQDLNVALKLQERPAPVDKVSTGKPLDDALKLVGGPYKR